MLTPVTTFDEQYSDPAATAVSWDVTPVVAAWAGEAIGFSTGGR